MGIAFATKQVCETIHIVADNESALKTLLDPTRPHGQQLVSVIACTNAREWLDRDARRRIIFHWCPSHVGIKWNEAVDADAKAAANLPPEREQCSAAFARHLLAVRLKSEWREQYRNSRPYAGHDFLRLRVFDPPKHTTSAALGLQAGTRRTMSRFCRAVLNHAPIGSFRTRFFKGEPTECPRCHVLQSRSHVLLECTRYERWWRCGGEFDFLQRLEAYQDLNAFITENDGAFTFADAPS
ncbi:uncharacterized protein BXZ73DRAFT_48264 [Epithele typhae]|uniref:uncharacterized protein n=1 Tax=Epithele typhae TaxID=378194 RepID=UPI00200864C1|nr:uncharacterized protein BXZ73DRAFT_48264 [Epithele typhae]KAH9929052.1 hypothetical protein BXZ73DRAFT_48264 [Epithele typhae]